jgi:transposase-like protein
MGDILQFFGVMMSIALAGAGGYAAIALVSAWVKRLERRGGVVDPALEEEVARLRERLAELEDAEGRLAELEERLDFAERMLTQAREARIGPGEG